MHLFFRRIATASLTLLAACSGGGDGGPTPPTQTPTIGISATTSTATAARGASASYALAATRGGGYTGQITLTAENVPAGVTASFTPPALGSGITASVLTLAVGPTAAAGTNTITVRATGTGTSAATTSVSLTVPTPAITLVAGNATATLVQGASTTVPLTITRTNGFTGPVTITVTGLPTGVTATLNPASPLPDGTTATTLTLTAAPTATVGAANVTVRANGGGGITEQTATIALTVSAAAAPGFTLTAANSTITAVAGQGGTSAITLARQGGFAGDVALTVTGAPAGVTATLAPTTLTGATASSTLTVASTAAAVPGNYTLTVRGNAAGQTERTTTIALTINSPPGVTLAFAPTTVTAAPGANGTSTITLARTGGFTGDVTLSAGGLPPGATASFAPATVAAAATSSVVTLSAGAATPTGTYTVTVTGTGAGGVTTSAPLTFVVAVPPGVTMSATNATAQQGQTGTSTVTLTRAGGFTGPVTLAAGGLPAGVTAVFAPQPATAGTSTLTLTVPAAVAAGTYTGTITGTAAGVTIAPITFTLTVTASGGGGGNIAYRFCQGGIPVFFAFRNGANGAWTPVTRTGTDTYAFTLSGNVGGVAFALDNGNGTVTMNVQYYTAAEFPTLAAQPCLNNPPTKSVSGTVAGLSVSGAGAQSATIALGNGSTSVTAPNTSFTIPNATATVSDLLAVRLNTSAATGLTTPDRMILRRDLNPPAGGTITPVLDFNAAESFAPASATYTVSNAGSDRLFGVSTFGTANGLGAAVGQQALGVGNTVQFFGVPAAQQRAGDQHMVYIGAVADLAGGAQSTRAAYSVEQALTNKSIALGPAIAKPTVSVIATAPYLRLRATGTLPDEYQEAVSVTFNQESGRTWIITASRGYLNAAGGASRVAGSRAALSYTLDMPDLSGVAGFQASWALIAAVLVMITLGGFGFRSGFAPEVPGFFVVLAFYVFSQLF